MEASRLKIEEGTIGMYARTTFAQFQPGASDEAMGILRNVMLPSASAQPGFKGALILGDAEHDRGVVITLWENEAALLASSAPEEILEDVDRLGELMTEQSSQHTYEVLLQV
jgi:heme-degrading monooxygenase HmoA